MFKLLSVSDEAISGLVSYASAADYAAVSVLIGLEMEARRDVLNTLAYWMSCYASELDAYVETVDILITPERYEAVRDYVERKRVRG